MGNFTEEVVEIKSVTQDNGNVKMEIVIKKTAAIEMFGSYDFQRNLEQLMAKRIVDNFPIEKLNEIQSKIDINAVAKGVSIRLIADVSGKKDY